mgnify:FL=1
MNELSEEDVRIRQAMSRETAAVPTVVREKMERLYATLPELAEDRRRYARRRRWSLGASIALLLAIVVTAGLATPTASDWLRQLPGLGSGFSTSGSATKFEKQTVEDQGIKLTLQNVIYDGTRLAIRIKHKPGIEIKPSEQMVVTNGASLMKDIKTVEETKSAKETEIVFDVLGKIQTFSEVKIHVNDIIDSRSGVQKKVSGDWTFTTTLQEWKNNVTEVRYSPPLAAMAEDGTKIAVTGIAISPLTTKVSYEMSWPKENAQAAVRAIRHSIRLTDDRGADLQLLSSGSFSNGSTESYSATFASLHEEVGELNLFVEETGQITGRSDSNDGPNREDAPIETTAFPVTEAEVPLSVTKLPITIEQGEAGSITFRKIELGQENTIIEFEVEGDDPYLRVGSWWVENEDRTVFSPFDPYDLARIGHEGYSFRIALPTWPDPSKLYIRVLNTDTILRDPIPRLELVLPLND